MDEHYPERYLKMKFHSCIGEHYYFYENSCMRLYVGDYSDFCLWRKAHLEEECRVNLKSIHKVDGD
jgi:hypothetical protein